MSNPRQYSPHYTVDDYQQWKGDWELWEGIAIAISPSPFGRHQSLVSRIATLLAVAIERNRCKAEMLVELDWIVSDDTVVRPGVMVVCGEPPERHLEHAPTVAVEVLSDSTRKNDLGYKRKLYQQHCIAAYIIVDLQDQTIVLDRWQSDGSYQTETVIDSVVLEICADCTLEVSIETLFR